MREVTRDLDIQPGKEDNESYVEMNPTIRPSAAEEQGHLPLGPATSYALSHVASQEQMRVNNGFQIGNNYNDGNQF